MKIAKRLVLLIPLAFGILFLAAKQPKTIPFNVMTFNIRYNNPADGENAWPNRKDMVASMIRFHGADLLGVQEALRDQVDDLAKRLPEYKWFGVGRDDGHDAGEFSAIFYRKYRFRVLDSGTFWLSKTPETMGSIGWDAACVRIVTWGKFKDRRSGKEFFHFNIHFDHRGQVARENSAKLLLKRVNKIAGKSPVIVTGDFNFDRSSPLYKIITGNQGSKSPRLKDAQFCCKQAHHGPDWSFNGFGKPEAEHKIDFIFVNDGINLGHSQET